MLDELQVNAKEIVIPQEFRNDIDAIYEMCVTVASKMKQEESSFKVDIETLTKDKNQLMKENARLLSENEYLKEQLKEQGKLIQKLTIKYILPRIPYFRSATTC